MLYCRLRTGIELRRSIVMALTATVRTFGLLHLVKQCRTIHSIYATTELKTGTSTLHYGNSVMKLRALVITLCTIGTFIVVSQAPSVAQMNEIEFTKYKLDNGLTVILHHDKSAPIVATVMHYRVGSRDEDPNRTGFAHFFEHLMFEATDNIPRSAMSKYVQEAGGNLNAYTSFDETVYHFRVPSNEVQLALWIESQRMRQLLVDDIGVETQRGVVKEERAARYDNSPYGNWLEVTFANGFKGGSYSWTPIGSSQHIDSAAIVEFREFYDNFYQPNNATLVIAGDFDEDEVREYVDAYFGRFERGPEPKRNKFILPEAKGYRETIHDPKAQLPAVFISARGPKIGEPDFYAMDMLIAILADGESSRLYQRLVDKDKVAVQAAAFPFALEHSGAFVAYGIAAPGGDIAKVEATINDELQRVIREGVTEEEFLKARNIKEAEFVNGKKDVMEKAQTLAQYETYFDDAGVINTEIEQYLKVTREDMQRVARKYFNADKNVVATYLPDSGDQGSAIPTDD